MKPILAASIAAAMLTSLAASAQETPKPAVPPQDNDYPGLGEVMALQQMRHIKLWFAGHAGNWPLADYEIGELKEGFDDAKKLVGRDTVENAIGAPMSALGKAIDAKDRTAFIAAFDKLTAGCNGCHRTLNHPFIVIQRPTTLPYSNQSFTAQK